MRKFFIISLVLTSTTIIVRAQFEAKLLGSWIKVENFNTDNLNSEKFEKVNSNFFKYTFNSDGFANASLAVKSSGFLMKYQIKGNTIDFGFKKEIIESITDSSMVLIDGATQSNEKTKILFLKEEYLQNKIPLQQSDFFVNNTDTIFFESFKILPSFYKQDDRDVMAFIQREVEGLSNNKESFALATFIISENGKISDITVHHHINKTYDKILIKAIRKTEGFWTSPKINGRKVKVLKQIKFTYIVFPDIKNEGRDLVLTHNQTVFPETYTTQFSDYVKLYYLNKYDDAIDILDNCKLNTKDPSNIYNQKIKIYNILQDTEKLNKNLELLKQEKLKYLWKEWNKNLQLTAAKPNQG